jgi:integrase
MRRSELLGLRWSDVDLDGGRVAVRQALVLVDHEARLIELSKTSKSRRGVTLDPDSLAVLRAWRRRQAEERLAVGPGWTDSGLVFTDLDGRWLHPETVSKAFGGAVKAAGVSPLTFHGLRHTAATLMLIQGVPLKVVSERLGHSSIAVTGDTYSHVTGALEAQAAAAIGAVIFGTGEAV